MPTTTMRQRYGPADQAFTITLGGLVDQGARASAAVDTSDGNFIEALVWGQLKTGGSGTIAENRVAYVYLYAVGLAGGYPEPITGTDAGFAPVQNFFTVARGTNVVLSRFLLIGTIPLVALSTTYRAGPWPVAGLLQGRLPSKWGIIVVNDSDVTLDADNATHRFTYQLIGHEAA